MAKTKFDLPLRCLDRIAFSDTGCWLWVGALNKANYGTIYDRGKMRLAHRYIYEFLINPIPDGIQIDHLCRIHNCVNPKHLEPVTAKENSRRGYNGYNIRTHCRSGKHLITEESIYSEKNGNRSCAYCRADTNLRRDRSNGK